MADAGSGSKRTPFGDFSPRFNILQKPSKLIMGSGEGGFWKNFITILGILFIVFVGGMFFN